MAIHWELCWPKSKYLISKFSKYWNVQKFDFQSYNWLLIWYHEQYLPIYQKTELLVNKFAVQARWFKWQDKKTGVKVEIRVYAP